MLMMKAKITLTQMFSRPDTDVFIICLSFHPVVDANLYFLTGVRNTRRIIDITDVVENNNQNLNLCESPKESLLSALVGFHTFTGCDTISIFAGSGKIKPLMLMTKTKIVLKCSHHLEVE